jgi:hypothetical protein
MGQLETAGRRVDESTSSAEILQATLDTKTRVFDPTPYRYKIEESHFQLGIERIETVGVHRTRDEAENDVELLCQYLRPGYYLAIREIEPPLPPTPPCRVKALMALLRLSLDVHSFRDRIADGEVIDTDVELLQELIDDLTQVMHRAKVGVSGEPVPRLTETGEEHSHHCRGADCDCCDDDLEGR